MQLMDNGLPDNKCDLPGPLQEYFPFPPRPPRHGRRHSVQAPGLGTTFVTIRDTGVSPLGPPGHHHNDCSSRGIRLLAGNHPSHRVGAPVLPRVQPHRPVQPSSPTQPPFPTRSIPSSASVRITSNMGATDSGNWQLEGTIIFLIRQFF